MAKLNKYYLLLTILDIISSSIILNDDQNIYFQFQINQSQSFILNCSDESEYFLSVLPLNKSNITIYRDNEFEKKNELYNKIIKCTKNENINITLSPENETYVDFFFTKINGLNNYEIIDEDEDDREVRIKNKNNFVRYLDEDNEKDIKVDIRFKNEIDKKDNISLFCGIVNLPAKYKEKDIDETKEQFSIPKANLFPKFVNDLLIQIDQFDGKEKSFKFKNITYDKNENKTKSYYALIFSIVSDNPIEKYYVTINKDNMSLVLIVFILLALLFAIISFFLIRRKQNNGKLNNDFYNEKDESEEKNEKEPDSRY